MILKDNVLDDKATDAALREYLIGAHPALSVNYPEVAGLDPVNAADFLLHLRKTGRIRIELFNESPSRLGCRIIELDAEKK